MHRSAPSTLTRALRRAGVVLVSCLAVATLASCGGGTQSKKFEPQALVVFGDELSLITSDGQAGVSASEGALYSVAKYVDGTTGPYDCKANYNWIMLFADAQGFKFDNECRDWISDQVNLKTAVMLANDPQDVRVDNDASVAVAVANAGVDAILAKMNANLSKLNDATLVTVNGGRADIVQAYRQYLASPESLSVIVDQLTDKGRRFAKGLKPALNTGARMLLVLSPRLGDSPLASQDAANATRNQEAMTTLSKAFNEAVELQAVREGYTGQQLGLVRLDQALEVVLANVAVLGSGNSYGLTNTLDVACNASTVRSSAPLCLESDLVESGAQDDYLWADATHLTVAGSVQSLFANYMTARLASQPF